MNATIAAFLISLISCFLIIWYQHLHAHVTGDNKLSEPQKIHLTIVPRIGGLAILIGLLFAGTVRWLLDISSAIYFFTIILVALPTWMEYTIYKNDRILPIVIKEYFKEI